jgi:alkanesulfonate monooxygenase SsuD/methylene tetrahydromethanopterin reductase-like flavin-dependent oxidoreductase (luciferase family)
MPWRLGVALTGASEERSWTRVRAADGGRRPPSAHWRPPSMTIVGTDEERAAVDDGQAALDSLLGRLANIPTPAGTTPRQLGTAPAPTFLPVIEVRHGKPG